MNFSKVTVLGLVMGLTASAHAGSPWSPVLDLKFDRSVPEEQGRVLLQDLERISALSFRDDTSVREIMGIDRSEEVGGRVLSQWLADRVSTIVGETFRKNTYEAPPSLSFEYPHSTVLPIVEKEVAPHLSAKSGKVAQHGRMLMSNIGVGLYYEGKLDHELLVLKLNGLEDLRITSPRVGIIKIGPALFAPSNGLNPKEPGALSNSLVRLKTLFHEARHGDGHGESLGFFHAVCPEGHDLAGSSSCDRNLNGPYTLGAILLRAMTSACKECSAAETEALRIRYLDSFSRVLRTSADGKTPATAWDPTPEMVRSQ
jgi:hypothetical protein